MTEFSKIKIKTWLPWQTLRLKKAKTHPSGGNNFLFLSSFFFLNRVISNYIAWTVVRNLIDALPEEYGSAHSKFLSKVFKTDQRRREPKWTKCIEVTSDVFPLPTASLFAAHALPKDRVNEVRGLCKNFKSTF